VKFPNRILQNWANQIKKGKPICRPNQFSHLTPEDKKKPSRPHHTKSEHQSTMLAPTTSLSVQPAIFSLVEMATPTATRMPDKFAHASCSQVFFVLLYKEQNVRGEAPHSWSARAPPHWKSKYPPALFRALFPRANRKTCAFYLPRFPLLLLLLLHPCQERGQQQQGSEFFHPSAVRPWRSWCGSLWTPTTTTPATPRTPAACAPCWPSSSSPSSSSSPASPPPWPPVRPCIPCCLADSSLLSLSLS
jgi:hypothetical protein